MKIKRKELLQALEIVKPGLAVNDVIEQATSFAFMDDKVVTYNDEISIAHPVSGLGLKGAIKAEEFYKLLQKFDAENLMLKAVKGEVIVKSGRSKAGLLLQSEITLPLEEVEQAEEWKDLPEGVIEALDFVMDSCSRDSAQPLLGSIHITPNYAEASDGLRISRHEFKEPLDIEANILLPASSARVVIQRKPEKISITEGWVHFQNESGTIISCRVFEDDFPDVDPYLQLQEPLKVTMPKECVVAMERASVFSSTEAGVITVRLQENKIVIEGRNDYGWFEEPIDADYAGEEFAFLITPKQFQDILQKQNEAQIDRGKMLFSGKNWQYLTVIERV